METSDALLPFESQDYVTIPNSNVVFPVGVLKKIPRTCLSIKDKVVIIGLVEEKRLKKTEIAERFGLPKSTLSTLVKNKEKILHAYKTTNDPSRKRVRAAAYPDLEEMLFKWIADVNAGGKIVSPQLLKVKAESFARRLGIPSFRTSSGWLQNFKRRNGLKFPKASTRSVEPEFSNIIDKNSVVPYRQQGNQDSDGAGSERSSDSEGAVHPVQLLQHERPKRLKRSLCEYNPDFIFYDKGATQTNTSEQMIVPYVHNEVQQEWLDPSLDGEPKGPQIKIEEPDEEEEEEEEDDDDDDYDINEDLESSHDESLKSGPTEPESPLSFNRTNHDSSSPSLLPVSSSTTDCITSESREEKNDIPIPATMREDLHVQTQAVPSCILDKPSQDQWDGMSTLETLTKPNKVERKTVQDCSEEETAAASQKSQPETIQDHPFCLEHKGHGCESMRHLAQSLERQAKAQEELLTLKKKRHSAEERHRKEEIELLKQKLAIEEKKVSVLEQLLAAYMQHPKTI